jgi:WD40 repeat protein
MDETAVQTCNVGSPSEAFGISKCSRAGGPVTCVALATPQESIVPTWAFAAQGPYIHRYNLSSQNQEQEYRLLVFPEGGTVHGIVFCSPQWNRNHDILEFKHSLVDSIVFGENRLAFCDLLSSKDRTSHCDVIDVDEETPERRKSFLTLSDWIWTVKPVRLKEMSDDRNCSSLSLVVGFGRHFLEVWNVIPQDTWMKASCLHRLYLAPATMVTSMDSFYQQRNRKLCVVAGTSFHKIWVSSVSLDEIKGERQPAASITCLKEHAGVVHSVKFSSNGYSLVSCSDDRSVRRWEWDEMNQSYRQIWVGWGHNARVWSAFFASDDESRVVSASEDGTARVWSSSSGESIACIQYGAASSSLWTIDVFGNLMLLGATDGIITMIDLNDRIRQGNLQVFESMSIPDDRPKVRREIMKITLSHSSSDQDHTKKKKRKIKPQVVVGMKWWHASTHARRLLVATREGSLYSLDLCSQTWKNLHGWCDLSISERNNIQPSDGCCMAVHDYSIALGTTRGHIVLLLLHEGFEKQYAVLNGEFLRSVQGLRWLTPGCLVSFHVRSVAVWDTDTDVYDCPSVAPSIVYSIETKGVPLSCARNTSRDRMVVGDSRGNLSLFLTEAIGIKTPLSPTSILWRVHQQEHVNDVKWLNRNTILSAGNDGCLHISYVLNDSLCRGWSFPAPSITGVTHCFFAPNISNDDFNFSQSPMLVGGYYGNIFRLMDVQSGYESIQIDTGGKQRILDCSVEIPTTHMEMPSNYNLAVCMGQRDGSNNIYVQQLRTAQAQNRVLTNGIVTRGVKLHGETIFGSVFFTLQNARTQFLVTASEDCTTRISAWNAGVIVDSLMLTPQPSCVRCTCSSQIDGSSVLLVVGGGKLTIQFFLVHAPAGVACKSVHDLRIFYIGQGRTTTKSDKVTLDHRINAVDAISLDDINRVHLVIVGDSSGNLHLFVVPETNPDLYKSIVGVKIAFSEWPIICVKALIVWDQVLVMFGTTKGNIVMIDLPKSSIGIGDAFEGPKKVWKLLGNYQIHGMGTNTIAAVVSSKTHNYAQLSVFTGGDDHSLAFFHVIVQSEKDDVGLSVSNVPAIRVVPSASYSAMKSLFYLGHGGRRYLFSVGYSQTLSCWKFADEGSDNLPQVISSTTVDLGDVNCMAVCVSSRETLEMWIAVCGMGVEMFRICHNSTS